MPYDLEHYLGRDFRGERLSSHIRPTPNEKLPLYHTVGALDPITDSDLQHRVIDGLPETSPEWIRYNGLRCLKVKLAGNDMACGLNRVTG